MNLFVLGGREILTENEYGCIKAEDNDSDSEEIKKEECF